jgi:hypothetical protein
MADHLAHRFIAIRHADPVDLEIEDPALIDALSVDLLFMPMLVIAHGHPCLV